MRLSTHQHTVLKNAVLHCFNSDAELRLFGSRVRDDARGGDLDLLLDLDEEVAEPASLAARLSARISRSMLGRRVDVIIKAPNLQLLPIHTLALAQGFRL